MLGKTNQENPMRHFLLIAFTLFFSASAHAALVKKDVQYKDGSEILLGYLVYDDSIKDPQPGVVVVHDWMGLTAENKIKVEETAMLGYVAFGADIYGKDKRPASVEDAAKFSSAWKADRKKLRTRINAALKVLQKQTFVDKNRLGATGYCFGGTTVLELARSGANVKAVATFHGGLDSQTPEDAKNIKAHLLVLHGADDPYVKAEDVKAFQQELRAAHVDWQMIEYGNAVHSFTIKGAGSDNAKGAAYNADADKRSWSALQNFFKETLH
jgi:dienelactone hydrolase